ncbi:MAG: YvcK family protein, partial [Acidobacteria bacterium]|nr:YvcK family protein [Acidobacteriota bacterium]
MIAPPPGYRDSAGPLRVVSIGGGTGLSTRKGLVDICAIVTVTDDGGSSGRLRRDFDILPPGDIRNCMVALSEHEALLSQLFQYRFDSGRGLKGHSFGNLFLTALTHVTGDFPRAVRVSSEVLAIYGRIYPSTSQNVGLRAVMQDGSIVEGETKISRSRKRIHRLELSQGRVKPLRDALDAIAGADLITIGPGSLYTSVIPNLLVDGIGAALRKSKAVKAYFTNLMWQPWETMSYSAADHVQAIHDH